MKLYAPLFICLFVFSFLVCESCKSDEVDRSEYVSPKDGINEDYTERVVTIWQKPELVIDFLGNLSNKTVVDLGTGYGFFSIFLSDYTKKVIALDIEPKLVARLDSIAKADKLNIESRLVERDDPLLEEGEAEAVLMCNVYMYIDNRLEYLKTLRKGMVKGGKLMIVDFKKKQTSIGPSPEIRVPLYQVERELESAGFMVVKSDDAELDYQYIIVAEN